MAKERIYNDSLRPEEQQRLEQMISDVIKETSRKIMLGAPCTCGPTRDGIREKLAPQLLGKLVRRLRPDLLANGKKKKIWVMLEQTPHGDYHPDSFSTERSANIYVEDCRRDNGDGFGPFEIEVAVPVSKNEALVREKDMLELITQLVEATH